MGHGLEATAAGDLAVKVGKGLAASQVATLIFQPRGNMH
jgi:hypothetical protein